MTPMINHNHTHQWERAGRQLLAGELGEARCQVSDAVRDLEETLRAGDDVDAGQVREARRALNRAHRALEQYVATTTDDVEPWERPPDIPMCRLWELTNHPKAEGVDPRAYVDDGGLEAADE